jgi:signal transduction histidine kinase
MRRGPLARTWSRLIEPRPSVVGIEPRRQAKLLAGMMLVFVVTNAAGVLATPPAGRPFSVALLVAFALLYPLSRTRHVRIAALLLITSLAVGILAALTGKAHVDQDVFIGHAAWQMLTLLCAQIFLPTRGFLAVVATLCLALLTTPLWLPALPLRDVWAGFGLVLTAGALLLVFQRHRDLIERDRLAELGAVNLQLQHEVATRRAAQIAAEAASVAKSRFLANMSHELRTPLNAVIGYVELVLENDGPRSLHAEDREALTRSLAASRHLVEIIGDILDLAKVEADKLELRPEQVDLLALFAELHELTAPLAAANDNTLELQTSAPPLFTDRLRLRQVLLNLLSNACRFTHRGRITLTTREQVHGDAPAVELVVRDTGIGIAPEQHQRIFEVFTQVDESSTRRHGGTGLGLALTHRLVARLGGTITVASALGQGSTFTVTLPRRGPETPAPP